MLLVASKWPPSSADLPPSLADLIPFSADLIPFSADLMLGILLQKIPWVFKVYVCQPHCDVRILKR